MQGQEGQNSLAAAIAKGAAPQVDQRAAQLDELHDKAAGELLEAIKNDDAKAFSKTLRNILRSARNQG